MKLFITGATGFLGKHLVQRLSGAGYEIVALGRNIQEASRFTHLPNVTFAQGDLKDITLLNRYIQEVDAVIHCAAFASPFGTYEQFYNANVIGTENMVNASLAAPIKKFIYLSTPSVYFSNHSRMNVRENDPLPNIYFNFYAKTKHLADLVVARGVENGLSAISLRPRQVFGPYDYTIFGRFIEKSRSGGIPLVNDGKVLMDFTYVDNVLDVIEHCLQVEGKLTGEIYNITNGQPIYLIDALKMLFQGIDEPLNTKSISPKLLNGLASGSEFISKITKKPPAVSKHVANLLTYDYTLNIEKAQLHLAYSPKVSLEEGIIQYSQWYQSQQHS